MVVSSFRKKSLKLETKHKTIDSSETNSNYVLWEKILNSFIERTIIMTLISI